MRRPILLSALVLVAGITALTACSGEDMSVEPVFAAEVTGAVARTAAGIAAFGVVPDGGSTGFTIIMEDEASGMSIVLQKPATARPQPGSYPIVPRDEVGPLGEYRGALRYVDGALQEFAAHAGTLVISETAPVFIKGTMEFQAVRTSPCCDPEPVTISVTGTFTAVQGPVTAAAR